jgi:poly-gamma-glutamate synthesis protein (capsule biosynthesis protein)
MKILIAVCLCFVMWSGSVFSQNDTTSITFTGDMMLGRGVKKEIQKRGRAVFFKNYEKYFHSSDIGIVNFECAIYSQNPPIKKQYNFDCDRENLVYLKKIGVSHLNLANNHSIDFGSCGLKETIEQSSWYSLSPIGYGVDSSQLFCPTIIQNKGNTIAIFTSVLLKLEKYRDSDCLVFVNQDIKYELPIEIKKFKNKNPDAVIVILLHWGKEEESKPSLAQQFYAHALIDNGADVIVGCGSHTLQEYQTYKAKRIYYSLGDFIFDRIKDQGGVLNVKIIDNKIIDFKLTNCFSE